MWFTEATFERTALKPALIAANEAERLAVLQEYGLLDGTPDPALDDLVALAARICQAPIGLLTLVDRDRQCFRARFGFDVAETPREVSFCAHTILQDGVFVVPDAQSDERFADNPMVTGEPGIRFYAGAPLRAPEGHALGALCIIDRKPREIAAEHRHALEILVGHAQALLEQRRHARRAGADLADSEARLRIFANVAPDAMIVIRADGVVEFANAAVGVVFGYPPAELIGRTLDVLQPERLREGHRRGLDRYLRTGERRLDWRAVETVGLHRDGHELPIEIAFSHFKTDGRDRFAGFIRDISQRKSAQAAMRESERRYRTLVESSGVGIWHLDRDRNSVYLNPAMLRMLELHSIADLAGRSYRDFLASESRAVFDREYARRASGETTTYEVEIVGDRGTRRQLLVTGAPHLDEAGRLSGTIGTLVDVSELRRVERQLGYLKQFDDLTGLPNRSLFTDRLAQALTRAERSGALVVVALVNIDRFREINDGFGHHVGDAVLRAIAGRLKDVLYREDTIARLGADEFAVVLEGLQSAEEARGVGERMREQFVAPIAAAGQELFVQASIGVALHRQDADDAEALMRVADLALEEAKRVGGAMRFGERGAEKRPSRRRLLDAQLRRALEREELLIEYEPMVDAHSGRVIGLEALLRWQSAEFGRLQPNEFIPLAEDTGLIVPIGEWVLSRACADLGRWHAAGLAGLVVAVNLSPRQLHEASLVQAVTAAMAGLPPGSIELELTERMLMEPGPAALGILAALREAGSRISVDDFGTGHSSLAYLKDLPIDKLKIDRTFVRDIGKDSGGEAIVHTVIDLARRLELTSIAEGVEEPAQREFLVDAGCDQLQGYHFSRAVSAERVPGLVEAIGSAARGSSNG